MVSSLLPETISVFALNTAIELQPLAGVHRHTVAVEDERRLRSLHTCPDGREEKR